MARDTHSTIATALDALDAAVDGVNDLQWDGLSPRQLMSVLVRLECAGRRLPVAGQQVVARLGREGVPVDFDGSSLPFAMAEYLLISVGEARRRIGDAAAQARGEIGREQIAIVREIMNKLPQATPIDVVADAEVQLAQYGAQFRPEQVRKIGRRILDTIAPDGELDDRERARRRGVTLGPQGTDGLSRINGLITPELRATLEPGLHKLAAPGMCNPDDETPCTSGTPSEAQIQGDARSGAQRNHDAMLATLRSVLMSGELGQHHGLPVSVIVSTTLQDLENAAGHGLTAGGTLLPMSDVIRLASHGVHYLCIFDEATELPLNLFRTRRCASEGQRIVLHARDRGCTAPGCSAPAYLCEVHHIDDYAEGGNTNIEDLALACIPSHHKLVKPGGWRTRRAANGRVEWIPPPGRDRGQPRTNDYHHPERLLGQYD